MLLPAVAAAALAAGCDTASSAPAGASSSSTTVPEGPVTVDPPPARLRRLLGRQYRNAVTDLLGEEAGLAASPPPDASLNGLDAIGASQIALDDAAVASYEASAWAITQAADPARLDAWLDCTPTGADDAACQQQLIARFGRVAWRRPLIQDELDAYTEVAQAASSELGDFSIGLEFALAGLLQSPNFLYLVELGEPLDEQPSADRLTGLELTTRMSFFLRDTLPSEDDLDAAEAGALATDDAVRALARTYLADPRAPAAIDSFYLEIFRLRELDTITKSPAEYPAWSPALAQSMKQETLDLLRNIVWTEDGDLRDLLTADYTFVADPALAALYGVAAPSGSGPSRVDLPPELGRAGMLGQASFLSVFAHEGGTSPTLRGKFVRERLLCESISPPPPGVSTTLPPDSGAKTMREQLLAHQTDPTCAGCHVRMDNIGFGFEHFDGIGAFRATENGVAIDASGEILDVGPFDDLRGLAELLRAQPAVSDCMVRNVFRQATGHVETAGEEDAIAALVRGFEADGHKLQDLLVEIVASPAFRLVGGAS